MVYYCKIIGIRGDTTLGGATVAGTLSVDTMIGTLRGETVGPSLRFDILKVCFFSYVTTDR